eukprot:gene2385-2850_t
MGFIASDSEEEEEILKTPKKEEILQKSITILYEESITHIFSFLTFKDYIHFNQTCKKYSTFNEEEHWKKLIFRQFPSYVIKSRDKNFKKIFQTLNQEKLEKQKKMKRKKEKTVEIPEDTETENEEFWEVDQILDYNPETNHYLVKWIGYNHSANTWEPYQNLSCKELLREYKKTKKMRKKNIMKFNPNTQYEKEIEKLGDSLIGSFKDRQIIDILDDSDKINSDDLNFSLIHSLIVQHSHNIIDVHQKKLKQNSLNFRKLEVDSSVRNFLTLSLSTKIETEFLEDLIDSDKKNESLNHSLIKGMETINIDNESPMKKKQKIE